MKKRNFIKKIILTAIVPFILAASFAEGCLTCSISGGNFRDFYIYSDYLLEEYYYAVTAEGRFIIMESLGNCEIVIDTMLYAQGLNAIDGYQFPFDGVFITGNSGKILKSNYNNTNVWISVNSGTTANLNDIAVCNDAFGHIFIVGDSGTILKSSNNGQSFFSLNSGTTLDLNEVQIIECDIFDDEVRIAGDSLITLYTTNGGDTWIKQYAYFPSNESQGFRVDLQTVHFIDLNTGWLAGAHYIFKTTNNGLNWQVRFKQSQSWDNSSNSIYFYNQDSGIIVGNRGDIQYTTSGGNNWFYNVNTQNLTTKNLNKFTLMHGVAAVLGDSGIVVYADSITVGIEPAGKSIPDKFSLYQNYPNPFNPNTTIKFQISEPAKVKLTVFNLIGKEVGVIVNKLLQSGIYEYNWDGTNFSSGIYIYQLKADNFIESSKMVLLK